MSNDLVKRLQKMSPRLDILECEDVLQATDRIEELEAKLAKAVEALERIEDASRYFGNEPEASETTVRYAHETTRRLCSTTLAELKGEKDEWSKFIRGRLGD